MKKFISGGYWRAALIVMAVTSVFLILFSK